MLRFSSLAVQSAHKTNMDDKIYAKSDGTSGIFFLADGATGQGYGRFASELFIERMKLIDLEIADRPGALRAEFLKADQDIRRLRYPCDTTGIAVVVKDGMIHGMSVGDSVTYLMPSDLDEPEICVSYDQPFKPRIGSGCQPYMPWEPVVLNDNLCLMGSDGLYEYLSRVEIRAICADKDREAIPQKLHDAVVNRWGKLGDDFSVIVIWNG